MKIIYRYKLKSSESVKLKIISEEEFFDALSSGENYEDDGVERYLDNRSLCVENIENMEWGELEISDSIKNNRTIKTEYFANGGSSMTYRKDADGYELIVQSVLISRNKIFISRMERKNINEPWGNTSYNIGCDFNGGENEIWYDLKNGELMN